MWGRLGLADGSGDTNQYYYGEPVLLFLPSDDCRGVSDNIIKRRSLKINNSFASGASSSHAGGLPQYHDGDKLCPPLYLTCTTCNHGPMHLLLQLHAPLDDVDRTLYMFGCNNASCHSSSSINSRGEDDNTNTSTFRSCMGIGSLRCFRSQRPWVPSPTATAKDEKKNYAVEDNDYWGADVDGGWGKEDSDNDDWCYGDNTTDLSMDDLESMMNDCEMRNPHSNRSSKPSPQLLTKSESLPEKSAAVDVIDESSLICDAPPSFKHYNLYTMSEPPIRKRMEGGIDSDDDDDDDDDVDGSGNIDVSKVEQMLSRYLDVEDDEAIISALRGGPIASNNDNSREGGERYERLPPEERAFLSFTRRLKRAPGQVARYAYGGSPMWSVPPPHRDKQHQHEQQQQQRNLKAKNNKSQKNSTPLPAIMNCVCGARRVFEFQILPSLLHVLDVDGNATKDSGEDDIMDLIAKGGMNWGVIAIYSCSMSCDESREEFVIVQNAVGDAPIPRKKMEKGDNSNDDD